MEQLPLLAMSAAVSALTFVAQGATRSSLEALPLGARAQNAIHAYAAYLGAFLWPGDLAVFYPYPAGGFSAASVIGALAILAAITALAWRARARCPAVIVGWLWYLGTLVPVIGIVQVGLQARASGPAAAGSIPARRRRPPAKEKARLADPALRPWPP